MREILHYILYFIGAFGVVDLIALIFRIGDETRLKLVTNLVISIIVMAIIMAIFLIKGWTIFTLKP